ncbi:Uncharacterised protein [Bordetella pertussis]|nr:Uncharacterised protein [Bordetella pertussis]CFO76949.1 Uncharacterised protein [Bordetella pertussis]CFU87953.1 Uncharacterised protein [Bordetella pertussis]CPI47677.1 Uncharacterised protein [Bordetella pertussis]CPL79930.1 Uncharacterised protein [Bordetella pertussis]
MKLPFTYSGERSENSRKPLLSGSISRLSSSLRKSIEPVMLTTAFSVSITNTRGVMTPHVMPMSAAAQLILTSSSPNSLLTT